MDNTIRILHVFGSLNRGGAETRTMEIYRNIDRSKVQFDFMINNPKKCVFEDEVTQLGGKIYRVPKYRIINHLKYKKEWFKFFKNNNHKIIHAHTSTAFIYLDFAKQYGIKTRVAHARNSGNVTLISKLTRILEKNIPLIATHLFAVSTEAGIYHFGENAVKKGGVKILPNGIDAVKFIYDSNMRELKRKELKIEDKFVIGHVGNFKKVKNHTFLIDIFMEVFNKNPQTVLMLVGDGELRTDIENKIEKLGMKNHVILTGLRTDVNDLLHAMDVFIFPSFKEGLPGSLIEAQTSGLHCFASDSITNEAKITNLAEYIPLKYSASYWAEKVMRYANGYERKNMQEEIKKAGFNVKETAQWLQEFYMGEI